MDVNDVVAERIEAARRRVAAEKERRTQLTEARHHGLQARHAAKLRRKGILLGFCATCARPLARGTYLLCSKGCGSRLCRGHARCAEQHNPQCPNRTTLYTDDPQKAPPTNPPKRHHE